MRREKKKGSGDKDPKYKNNYVYYNVHKGSLT